MSLNDCIDVGRIRFYLIRELTIEGVPAVVWEERTEKLWTTDPQRVYATGRYATSPGEPRSPPPIGYARSCSDISEGARKDLLGSNNPQAGFEKRLLLFRKGVTPSQAKQPMKLAKLGTFSVGQKVRLLSEGETGKEYSLDGIVPRYDPRSERVVFEFNLGFLPPGAYVAERKVVEGTPEEIAGQITIVR